jgi:FKBP-type peptidyl-prolyl cis-trans isomerase
VRSAPAPQALPAPPRAPRRPPRRAALGALALAALAWGCAAAEAERAAPAPERPPTYAERAAWERGAVTTPGGAVIIAIEQGTGSTPAATDQVRVHYTGTLENGTVFDSSRARGEPAVFALNRVIPCWSEALQRMRVGGRAKVVCTPNIAYGARGSLPAIPGNATLIFDIELLAVGR